MGNLFYMQSKANADDSRLEPLLPPSRSRLDEAFEFNRQPIFAQTAQPREKIETRSTTQPALASAPRLPANVAGEPQDEDGVAKRNSVPRQQNVGFFVHKVRREDTLMGLSLRYGVSTDQIRRANFMVDDRLISFVEVLIPGDNSENGEIVVEGNDDPNDEDKTEAEDEERRRDPVHRARMVGLFEQVSGTAGKNIATYYLEKNLFNLRRALSEAEADHQWERAQSRRAPPGPDAAFMRRMRSSSSTARAAQLGAL